MAPMPIFVVAGAAIGALTGLFGIGGSSIATPLLALLGVPPLLAVASPLPAAIPASIAALAPWLRTGAVRRDMAGWSLASAAPAAVAGAVLSHHVGGHPLLVASGLVLMLMGGLLLRPGRATTGTAPVAHGRPLLVLTMGGVGLASGLLANGGGFLIVPAYLLVFGLGMREAVATSLVVVAGITAPTLVTHWALGHIDWGVALAFTVGAVPASRLTSGIPVQDAHLRRAFGWFLLVSGAAFTLWRLAGH